MGTKLNPGSFDCHDAALPDEPRFTLLGRDPIAPFLISIWSSIRNGDHEAASVKFDKMLAEVGLSYWTDPDVERAAEALECAMEMFGWRKANLGRWRAPVEQSAQ